MVASAREIVSGLSTLLVEPATPATDWTFGHELTEAPLASNSTVTWVGDVTCPGATRANSSSRLCGFCTMPTTRRATPPWRQLVPTPRLKSAATPAVTATCPGPTG